MTKTTKIGFGLLTFLLLWAAGMASAYGADFHTWDDLSKKHFCIVVVLMCISAVLISSIFRDD
jgi:hypothetical protein